MRHGMSAIGVSMLPNRAMSCSAWANKSLFSFSTGRNVLGKNLTRKHVGVHLASCGGCGGQLAGRSVRAEAHGLQHPLRGVQEGDVRESRAQRQRAQLRPQPDTCRRVVDRHHACSIIRLCSTTTAQRPQLELVGGGTSLC